MNSHKNARTTFEGRKLLVERIALMGRRAHAGVQQLNIRSVGASKLELLQESQDALNGFVNMLSHIEELERRMLVDLAQKGEVINTLKRDGLPAEDCNFNLVPGKDFVFGSQGAL